ncbi:MAG: YdiY family protein [Hyphomonas sp.]
MKLILAAIAAGSCLALSAHAQESQLKGEGSFSAGLNTGNTETSDLGIGVKMSHENQIWRNGVEVIADYGTKNGSQTKNRVFFAGQSDRTLNDRLFAFGRLSHEIDEFSGFETRSFAGGGLGWQIFQDGPAIWSVEGGPGIKFDRVKSSTTGTPPVTVPAESEESFSVRAASKFGYTFNEAVKFGNDTNLIYADTSTQIGNKTTLTALLTKSLSARFSFEVRHDTDPQSGFEPTDTATRMSLVYAFGG